jgi:D-methionine transport system ATP-binding protein
MEQSYIEIKNLSKTYTAKNGTVKALQDVSLSIPQNEIYGVIGLSGAGKSTLVRCMNLLEKPDSGEIYIDGQNLLALGKEELRLKRQRIGMIFQPTRPSFPEGRSSGWRSRECWRMSPASS